VDALATALAGCMSSDIAHILTRGRHSLRALTARFVGDRAQEDPHRFVRIALHFTIDGDVPPDAVDRAVALSREKYCSVWHSMRQDIDFTVTIDLRA
jgi:putative redox protein